MMDSSDFLELLRALTHLTSTQLEGAGGWSAELYRTITFPQLVTVETFINVDLAANGLSAGIGIGDLNIGTWGTRVSRLEFTSSGGSRRIDITSYKGSFGPRYLLMMNYQPNIFYVKKQENF